MSKTVCLIAAVIAAGLMTGCQEETKDERGIRVRPDRMYESPAYRSQQVVERRIGSPDGNGGTAVSLKVAPSVLEPVPGTVARGVETYALDAKDVALAAKLQNPLLPTTQVLKAGARHYRILCSTCHGADGDPTTAPINDFLPAPPLNDVNVTALSDGQIQHIIARGRARMPGFSAQIPLTDRWAVVLYLRALSRAAIASKDVAKVLAAAENELRLYPDKPDVQTKVKEAKSLLEQREADLKAIKAVSAEAAAVFLPAPEPKPEWEQAGWPQPSTKP